MQVAYPYPAAPAVVRTPGPSLRVSLTLVVVGVVIALPSAFMFFRPFFAAYTTDEVATPGAETRHLDAGTYAVYARTRPPMQLSTEDVTVTGADGTRVSPRYSYGAREEVTHGTTTYVATVYFDVRDEGRYTIQVDAPGEVLVTRSLTDAVEGVIGWFLLGLLGGALFAAGVIMVIVGAVRRSRARDQQQWYGPPPSWAPPPGS